MKYLVTIPPRYRRIGYDAFALANLVLGIAALYGVGIDREIAALNLAGVTFGLTARSNVDVS